MIIYLLIALFVKHFIFDFVYQPPWMFLNKGYYGRWGGVAHSGLHAIASLVILMFFTWPLLALLIALSEFAIHYHVDYLKMKLNSIYEWKCDQHNQFWILLGFDQLLHSLTYLGIAGLVFTNTV